MGHRITRPIALSLAISLAALAPHAGAERTPRAEPGETVRSTPESALVVTGTIDVDAAGKVVGFTIHQRDLLPPGLVKMANEHVPAWTFEPATLPDGIRATRMHMSMLFVARKSADGQLRVTIRHPVFQSLTGRPRMTLVRRRNTFQYPEPALRAGVGATVHAIVRVDRTGRITDVMVEQVNLDTMGTEERMSRWRDLFATAVMLDLRNSRFDVADGAFREGETTIVGRFPLIYSPGPEERRELGRWFTYIPGPRTNARWPDAITLTAWAPDALAPEELATDDPSVRRLTSPTAPGGAP